MLDDSAVDAIKSFGVCLCELVEVKMSLLDICVLTELAELIDEGRCYKNAVVVGQRLDALGVVYGIAYDHLTGVPYGHCWVELSEGVYVDPTYQQIVGEGVLVGFSFFAFLKVDLVQYSMWSRSIRPSDAGVYPIAIDDLRLQESWGYLFT